MPRQWHIIRLLFHLRSWRNRHTRTFEGRVVNTVRVQVSSTAPSKKPCRQSFAGLFYAYKSRLTHYLTHYRFKPATRAFIRSALFCLMTSVTCPYLSRKKHLKQSGLAKFSTSCFETTSFPRGNEVKSRFASCFVITSSSRRDEVKSVLAL